MENSTLTLTRAYEVARSLELASKNTARYNIAREHTTPNANVNAVMDQATHSGCPTDTDSSASIYSNTEQKCYFCGNKRHPRRDCPARDALCHKCQKIGHYGKVCKGKQQRNKHKQSAAAVKTHETYDTDYCYSTILAAVKPNDAAAHVNITIQGKLFRTLCDTGSNKCYISPDAAKRTNLTLLPHKGKVTMAAADLTVQLSKKIIADFYMEDCILV